MPDTTNQPNPVELIKVPRSLLGIFVDHRLRMRAIRRAAKDTKHGINMAAKRWAQAHGADDVVFRSPSGGLLEGPTCSVVLDLDGVLVTPPLDGILRSITVEELVAKGPAHGLDVRFGELSIDDLDRCRGAWLLSSGRILARVTHVDGRELPVSPLDAQVARAVDVPLP